MRGAWLALAASGCTPFAHNWDERVAFPEYVWQADELTSVPGSTTSLNVVTWNLKFAGARLDFWFDGWGDRVHMTEAEVLSSMDDLVTAIRAMDPDVLLTQEVDLASKRTAYVDMVDHLLQNTELNYAAWVPVWQVAYIPEEGLGPVMMGQAVFSKYPLHSNLRIDLGPIENQDPVTRWGYLDRCIQRVTVEHTEGDLEVLNNHPDAYSTDGTKARQIEQIYAESLSISGDLLVGGDFNAVPPGTLNLGDFEDNVPLDEWGVDDVTYEAEGDQLMVGFYGDYQVATSIDDYQVASSVEEQEPWFTHSISSEVFWNRKLDYLFSSLPWTMGKAVQDQVGESDLDAMALSDHCPVQGVLSLQ
ncbi:MAG: endonuclease/exonuclease/phosphatase family protein [Myxococcota bacterium]|nr:endonuclease/exonuclease/phosphatase family protein [Myxococcota bacterium]